MTVALTWPDNFGAYRFGMRMEPNNRRFQSPYTRSTQVIDLIGERWIASMTLTVNSYALAQRIESFFSQLRGMDGTTLLWHLARPTPSGTMRGVPELFTAVEQGDSSMVVQAVAGESLLSGDMLGVSGHLVMVAANCSANAQGRITVPIANRFRKNIAAGTAVAWLKPTAKFRMSTDMAAGAVMYGKAIAEQVQVEFTETFP